MIRAELDTLTPLQQRIVEDVRIHGASTAAEISERLDVLPAAVSMAACYARGARWLDDGSIAERVGDGFAWSPGPQPIRWRFIPDDEATENVAEGRWL